MPLDIIQQEIYTGSVILLSISTSVPYLATPHLSLHIIGCNHIPSYFAFPIIWLTFEVPSRCDLTLSNLFSVA